MGFTPPCLYSPQVELVAKPVISGRGSAEAGDLAMIPKLLGGGGVDPRAARSCKDGRGSLLM